MKIARNVKAISKILFILLLLLAMIIGSIFSYLLLVGYYINLGIEVPENTTLSVIDVSLNIQNAETFNITILNPTYSPTEAKITEISIATEDDEIHTIMTVDPELPYELDKGQEETFNCVWNWGDFTGETLKVIVLVEDGSGAVYEIETASVGLEVTSAFFITADTQHFNVTIKNPEGSASDLNVTKITVTMENGTDFEVRETTPSIPITLLTNTSTTFVCSWNWTYYRGMNATINVYTSQGYEFHRTETTPKPAQLSITDTTFDTSTMTYFNITVKNSENSIVSANLTLVEIMFGNYTTLEVSIESPPDLPYTLPIGGTVTLKCLWDWSDNREETVAIYVETPEGYLGYLQQTIP
ncbi:MAG: hypothetical protein IBV52_05095 [Candidatus Bathyarchaeota archaeon]